MRRSTLLPAALFLAPALSAQTTWRVNLGVGGAQANADMGLIATVSGDGSTVAFCSSATNLVASDTNNLPDVFVLDRLTNTMTNANATSGGTQGNGAACPDNSPISLTPDGLYVVFTSAASNITINDLNTHVDVFVRHLPSGGMGRISDGSGTLSANGPSSVGRNAITDDGQFVVFSSDASNLVPGDTNGVADVFLRNRLNSITQRISLGPGGVQPNQFCTAASISGDGRYVAFTSAATNLVAGDTNNAQDVFVRDLVLGTLERVSVGPGGLQANSFSSSPTLSSDGRWLAFMSGASNLVPGDTYGQDIFVRDLLTGALQRASVNTNEVQCLGGIFGNANPQISRDGRFVVFNSDATNLASGDGNNAQDVFLRDLQLGVTERLSVDSGWAGGNAFSNGVAISGDGRFAVFVSAATNLVAGDTNGVKDVFLRDRLCSVGGETELASEDSGGAAANGQSAFQSGDPYGDRQVSADGRWIAFESSASDLVTGDTNAVTDVFVRDRSSGVTQRVSVSSAGAQANGASYSPSISADGRYVAFESSATNLVPNDTNGVNDIFLRDLVAGTTQRVSLGAGTTQSSEPSHRPSLSADGRFVVYTSIGNTSPPGFTQIYRRDLQASITVIVSVSTQFPGNPSAGTCDHASISADGRYVAFESNAPDLAGPDFNFETDIFVRDMTLGSIVCASLAWTGNGAVGLCGGAQISSDGQSVAFLSFAPDLVPVDTNGCWDVFVRDLRANRTERVSVSPTGLQAQADSYSCSISADGRFVAFESLAPNIVIGDGNGVSDVFLRDRLSWKTSRASVFSNGVEGNAPSLRPSVSPDGRHVAFLSETPFAVQDTNVFRDVYVHRVDFNVGCPPDSPVAYCVAGVSSNGCRATLASSASPSVSFAHGCQLTVSGVEGQKLGVIFYGIDNTNFLPSVWGNGSSYLCVKAPTRRTGTQGSAGTAGACDGSFALDWNAFRTLNPGTLGSPFAVGSRLYVQAWYRDPPAPKTTNLSNALELVFVP